MTISTIETKPARLILFDGGDAGGLYIDASGVHPIPPLSPAVLAQLRGVSHLLRSATDDALDGRLGPELNSLITRISNIAIERVEAAVGPLSGDDALVYLNEDGSFICGSTGAPPRLIPWPALGPSSPEELAQHRQLTAEVSDFLRAARDAGLTTSEVFEAPSKAAEELGFRLSAHAASSLQQIAPSKVAHIQDPVNREIIGFYHKVVADGRFIERWATQPASVAESLGDKLSISAIDRILGSGAVIGGPVSTPEVVTDVVIIVGVLLTLRPGGIIEDRSLQRKF